MNNLIKIRQKIISPIITLNGNSIEELLKNETFIINTKYGKYISPKTNSSKIQCFKVLIKIPKECSRLDLNNRSQLLFCSTVKDYEINIKIGTDHNFSNRYVELQQKITESPTLKNKKELNILYNTAICEIAIEKFYSDNKIIIDNIKKYGLSNILTYEKLFITTNEIEDKFIYKNIINGIYKKILINYVNMIKMNKLANKLYNLNYFENE